MYIETHIFGPPCDVWYDYFPGQPRTAWEPEVPAEIEITRIDMGTLKPTRSDAPRGWDTYNELELLYGKETFARLLADLRVEIRQDIADKAAERDEERKRA